MWMFTRPSARHFWFFLGLWLFVIFVSVFDGFLAVRYRHDLHATELNPLGRWLIKFNSGQVWLLVAVKFAGTIAAATAVLMIYGRWPRGGMAIVCAMAAFQLWLLWFLLFT
jgi:hypothetical protein